jgi:hypothetical protein
VPAGGLLGDLDGTGLTGGLGAGRKTGCSNKSRIFIFLFIKQKFIFIRSSNTHYK